MEPIKWHALTPAQRDETIHEKMFGHERTTKHFLAPDYSHVWSIGEHYKINSYQTWQTGGPHTPCYSRSLDDAWLVLQEIVKRYRQTDEISIFTEQMLAVGGWDSSSAYSEIYPACEIFAIAAKWTPEAICIAALRAMGYGVVIEEARREALADIANMSQEAGEY